MTGPPARRGALLLEVLVSIALFVGAATSSIAVMRSVLSALDRARRSDLALDLARAKLGELEAGLTTITDLRDARRGIDRVGTIDALAPAGDDPAGTTWEIDVRAQRSAFPGLSLVELTVEEAGDGPGGAGGGGFRARATLRELLPLNELPPRPYKEDEMLRDLPEAAE